MPSKKPQTVRVKKVDQRPPDMPPESYIEFDDFLPFPPPFLFNVHPVFNVLLNPLLQLNSLMFETSFMISMGNSGHDIEDEEVDMDFDEDFDDEVDFEDDFYFNPFSVFHPEEEEDGKSSFLIHIYNFRF
jgi:hypothetical protein